MLQADESTLRQLRDAVHTAALRSDVRDAVEQVYRDLADEVAKRRPVCVVSGRCCRFEEFGHRLFVTTAELATFVHGFERQGGRTHAIDSAMNIWDGTGCPFQVAKLCGVHALRPFGCRIFFCDATATQWQNDTYEAFHARLKRLHEDLGLPYFYIEWRQALRAILPDLPAAS
jgi:Fe-S-cluster containining protein